MVVTGEAVMTLQQGKVKFFSSCMHRLLIRALFLRNQHKGQQKQWSGLPGLHRLRAFLAFRPSPGMLYLFPRGGIREEALEGSAATLPI